MVAMLAGAATFTSTAASAATHTNYPPLPPKLVVNKGKVKQNSTVHVTGRKYVNREKVYVTITYPRQGHRRPVVRTVTVYANRSGTFSLNLRLTGVGRVSIKARGAKSRKSATVYVTVVKKRGRSWDFRSAVLPIGTGSTGSTGPATATQPAQDRGLAIAGFGVLALLGSAVITRQATRRRRRVYAA
jgi:hypothetical protein